MGTLAEKIAALRVKMIDSHADEVYLATRLKADIAARDAELMSEIMAIIEDHDGRRRDVAQALELLARRIGRLPRLGPPVVTPGLPEGTGEPVPPQRQVGGMH